MFSRLLHLLLVLFFLRLISPSRAATPATLPAQGRVTSQDGKPIAGATVWVISRPWYQKPQIVLKTTSRADGSFDLSTVHAPNDIESTLSIVARADSFALAGSSRAFDVVLSAPVSVRVRLRKSDGGAAAGVKVSPFLLTGGHSAGGLGWWVHLPDELLGEFAVTSDTGGVATLPYLSPSSRATLRVLDESFAQCDFREGFEVPAADLPAPVELRLLPAGSIEGRVFDANGKPVPGVYVSAQGSTVGRETGGTTYTDEQGRYVLNQLRPGTFNVALGLNHELEQSWTAVAYESLVLAEGQRLADKDFKLIPGTLITGKLMDADTHQPLAGHSIGVYGPAHPKSGAWVQSNRTAKDGTYRLRVPAGEQYVYFQEVMPEGYVSVEPESKSVRTTEAQGATVDFLLRRDKKPR